MRPQRHRSCPKAQRIHGISPADIEGTPTLAELRARIVEAVTGARVVHYNVPFDAGFLRPKLAAVAEIRCAMQEFAEAYGEWSAYHGSWHCNGSTSPRPMSASSGLEAATGPSTTARRPRRCGGISQTGRDAPGATPGALGQMTSELAAHTAWPSRQQLKLFYVTVAYVKRSTPLPRPC